MALVWPQVWLFNSLTHSRTALCYLLENMFKLARSDFCRKEKCPIDAGGGWTLFTLVSCTNFTWSVNAQKVGAALANCIHSFLLFLFISPTPSFKGNSRSNPICKTVKREGGLLGLRKAQTKKPGLSSAAMGHVRNTSGLWIPLGNLWTGRCLRLLLVLRFFSLTTCQGVYWILVMSSSFNPELSSASQTWSVWGPQRELSLK